MLDLMFNHICLYMFVCVSSSRFMITSAASCVPFMKTTASLTSSSVPGTARTGTDSVYYGFFFASVSVEQRKTAARWVFSGF